MSPCRKKYLKKKTLKNPLKTPLIFQFSWAMKTLKFWANPWNTHENFGLLFMAFNWHELQRRIFMVL